MEIESHGALLNCALFYQGRHFLLLLVQTYDFTRFKGQNNSILIIGGWHEGHTPDRVVFETVEQLGLLLCLVSHVGEVHDITVFQACYYFCS